MQSEGHAQCSRARKLDVWQGLMSSSTENRESGRPQEHNKGLAHIAQVQNSLRVLPLKGRQQLAVDINVAACLRNIIHGLEPRHQNLLAIQRCLHVLPQPCWCQSWQTWLGWTCMMKHWPTLSDIECYFRRDEKDCSASATLAKVN